MTLIELGSSILLAIFAILLIAWIGKIIFRALATTLLGGLPIGLWLSVRTNVRRVENADKLIETQQLQDALNILRTAMILQPRRLDVRGIEAVVAHNLGVLSRFGMIADMRGIQSETLAVVEGLLSSRLEMWRLSLQSKNTADRVRSKMDAQGGDRPWVTEELQRRREDITGRLAANKQALEQQLKKLCEELLTEPRPPMGYPFH